MTGITTLPVDISDSSWTGTDTAEGIKKFTNLINNRVGNQLYGKIGERPTNITDNLTLNVDRVSHSIVGMYTEDGKIMCDVKVLDTPYGNILQQIANDSPSLEFKLVPNGYGIVKTVRQADGTVINQLTKIVLVSMDIFPVPASSHPK